MLRTITLATMLAAGAVAAGETRLNGDEILSTLTGATVVYEGARQVFHASGVTDYTTDRPSQGRWAVRAGQYCSTWPPSDTWACYDVLTRRDGGETVVIWIGSDRSRAEGRLIQKD